MALSLVCKQCSTPLRSVAEAQDHGEVTGHDQFEESKEAVLTLVCTTCRKPCRSDVEKELHTQRTGHSDYENKTSDASVIQTEAEMKQAGSALEDYTAPALSLEGSKEIPMVPPLVHVHLRQQLEDMGFSGNKATRSLYFTGTDNLEQAVQWITEHEADPDVEEPLLVSKEEGSQRPKRQLSKEEARREAEELMRKAKIKRDKEERENEKLREQERVRAGKELAQAKRQEEDLQLKRNMDARRIEKAEAARAKEKIRAKLEEDRKERRRKLGLPEDLTAEEQAKLDAEKAQQLQAKQARPVNAPPAPRVSIAEKLRTCLVGMKKANADKDEQLKACWATLLKYCGNIAQNPAEEKFRKIKLSNPAFHSRVGSLAGGLDFLRLVGFQLDSTGSLLEMPAAAVSNDVLVIAGSELNNASTNPYFGIL